MRILFWGTPSYALASLEAIHAAGHQLVGVVSQPDRRRGRGKELVPSPVKARALDWGVPVFTPERIRRDPSMQETLAALGADVSVVVAFGQILPPEVLSQPPLGCWNGHGSLLPRWRGAAPIQWALLEGDVETGVGIMAMEAGLDTGPVLLERHLRIGLLDNATELGGRLAQLTGELLVQALPRIEAAGPVDRAERWRRLGLVPQSEAGLTYARLLTKEDRQLVWAGSALALHRRVMALHPGATCRWGERGLKVVATEPLVARLADQLSPEAAALVGRWGQAPDDGPPLSSSPGEVLAVVEGLGLVVATGGCPLLIRAAQLEGKAVSRGTSLVQQLGARVGDRLG